MSNRSFYIVACWILIRNSSNLSDPYDALSSYYDIFLSTYDMIPRTYHLFSKLTTFAGYSLEISGFQLSSAGSVLCSLMVPSCLDPFFLGINKVTRKAMITKMTVKMYASLVPSIDDSIII